MQRSTKIFQILLLFHLGSSSPLDGGVGEHSLLRPKAQFHSRNDIGLSSESCPGRSTCMSSAECLEDGGIRKMGLCPNRNEVCCKVPVAPSCGASSTEWITEFKTPDYPNATKGSTECIFSVLPLPGVCAMKIDFLNVMMAGSTKFANTYKCFTDTFFILNIPHAPAEPLCDLKNYSAIFWINQTERQSSSPVKFVFVLQSVMWRVKFRVTQVNCPELQPWKNEPLCGRQLMYDAPSEENQLLSHTVHQTANQKAENALIVNGRKAEGHEFPWQISIQTKLGDHRCGGSLIKPNIVLTAAHCFHTVHELHKLNIRLGTANGTLEGEEVEIESIVQHYEYKPFRSHINDITIVRLKRNVTYSNNVQPICLPGPDENFDSGEGLISGWGLLSGGANGSSPIYLQKLGVRFLSNDECDERMPEAYAITLGRKTHVNPIVKSQLCAIAPKNTSVCFGDSGGPLVTLNETDGTYRQVAIVSYGIGRCTISTVLPTVYSRVSEFLRFIAIAAQY